MDKTNSGIQMLNLNCGGLPSKFNRVKMFISSCNYILIPISVITIQDIHFNHNTDLYFYELPEIHHKTGYVNCAPSCWLCDKLALQYDCFF